METKIAAKQNVMTALVRAMEQFINNSPYWFETKTDLLGDN
jgi:hypothetical protein